MPTRQDTTCSEETATEEDNLPEFLAIGCGCQQGDHKLPCSTLFSQQHFEHFRLDCKDLTRRELDMVILGQVSAGVDDSPNTTDARYRHGSQQRRLTSMKFDHRGHQICEKTFRMLHGIGK